MKKREVLEKAAAILFAAAVWQAASMLVGSRLILASPVDAAVRLAELCVEAEFWRAVGFTLLRILCGYGLGVVCGTALALLAGEIRAIRLLLWPFMSAARAVPVASFIILCLFWLRSSELSIIISFLMVAPVIYTDVLHGIDALDEKMLEMCRVFRVGRGRRTLYVTLPQIKSYLLSGCAATAGMAWKAGTAAEFIGIPTGSIGEKLYEAKIYLASGDLFAWTLTIVLISAAFEKLTIMAVNAAYRAWED